MSNGEQIDGWRVVADGKVILEGKAVGRRRIRLLRESVAAARCELEIAKSGPAPLAVSMRRYRADPELVRTVLDADGDTGETDTARWMQGAKRN